MATSEGHRARPLDDPRPVLEHLRTVSRCGKAHPASARSGGVESENHALVEALCAVGGRATSDAIVCTKAERELGYKAEVTLERGLQDTFAWYLDHQWWWRRVMDGSDQRWIETHYR